MNTTTRKARLSALECYFMEHPPKDAVDVMTLFYHIEQAINWKDGVEPDGYIFDFYDYLKTCVEKEP